MRTPFSYAFEELTDELVRPSKAALRAMLTAGMMVTPRGWSALSVETRQALALAGTHEQVNANIVAELAREAGIANLKLVPKTPGPGPEDLRPALVQALGSLRSLSPTEWASLRALDRYVLDSLVTNTRLLWRAIEEIARTPGSPLLLKPVSVWCGLLARCEVMIRPEQALRLQNPGYLDGRAMILARTAGVRAARKAFEMLDLHAETVTGPIELDWTMTKNPGIMLWQGHVSTWEGEFFPAGSLLAVSVAAIALCDMAKTFDPHASVGGVGIAEESWKVGAADDAQIATAVFTVRR